MGNGRAAALPSLIAQATENHICSHRRERKVLFEKQPTGWKDKLALVNQKIMTIVFDLKHNALATASYQKKNVIRLKGQLEFIGKAPNHEMLRIRFQLSGEATEPAGPGKYFLYSKTFPERELTCVSATAERSGFDLLKEHYAGLLQSSFMVRRKN